MSAGHVEVTAKEIMDFFQVATLMKQLFGDQLGLLLVDIVVELEQAKAKYPSAGNPTTVALATECGELMQASLKEPLSRVQDEAVQVAAMAIRLALEGDDTLRAWREARGLDVLPRSSQEPSMGISAGLLHGSEGP